MSLERCALQLCGICVWEQLLFWTEEVLEW